MISYWVFPELMKQKKVKPSKVRIDYIINRVCFRMSVRPETITKKIRFGKICAARHMVVYFLYHYTIMSLMDVARSINRKDHATIINSLEVCENILDNDKGFKYYEELMDLLKEIGTTPRIEKRWRKQKPRVKNKKGVKSPNQHIVKKQLKQNQ
jgi:chromosomal replication initiation ATPase DnaA